MDNQKLGYVPLYRSIKKKSWQKDVYLRTLWEDLLLGAQRKPRTVNFKGNQWNLQVGQLVVTAADLGLSLCDREGKPTSRDAVGRMLNFFVKEGMISMDGEKRKGTVITILNYAEYAEKIDNLPAHKTAHYPAHDEASNGAASEGGAAHYPALKAAHHEQEGNNKNINNKPPLSPLGEKNPKRATQFPTDFSPTAGNTKLANTLGVDLQNELDAFTDYHKSKGSTYKDWGLAFNTWIRNAIKFGKPAAKRTGVAQPAKPSSYIPEGFK